MIRRSVVALALALPLSLVACDDAGDDGALGGRFLIQNVVFGTESETTYVNTLQDLEPQEVDFSGALEIPGWGDLWVYGDMAFVSSGDEPVVTRYAIDDAGVLSEDGQISFLNYGLATVGLTRTVMISATKAYVVNGAQREIIVWNPTTLLIEDTFAMPELPNRGDLNLAGPSADRASAIHGDYLYLVFYWARWSDYMMTDDSVLLVVDTRTDTIANTISVPCPELNFATVDTDEGDVYFSNWGFSPASHIVLGVKQSCAVRIHGGETELDPTWSLTFADATDGREATSLRYLGDGKALITVLHSERLAEGATVGDINDGANSKLWTLDLATKTATPLETFGFHAFGTYGTRIGGSTYLYLPTADWASTTTYRLDPDGTAETLWTSAGWQTRLFNIR